MSSIPNVPQRALPQPLIQHFEQLIAGILLQNTIGPALAGTNAQTGARGIKPVLYAIQNRRAGSFVAGGGTVIHLRPSIVHGAPVRHSRTVGTELQVHGRRHTVARFVVWYGIGPVVCHGSLNSGRGFSKGAKV